MPGTAGCCALHGCPPGARHAWLLRAAPWLVDAIVTMKIQQCVRRGVGFEAPWTLSVCGAWRAAIKAGEYLPGRHVGKPLLVCTKRVATVQARRLNQVHGFEHVAPTAPSPRGGGLGAILGLPWAHLEPGSCSSARRAQPAWPAVRSPGTLPSINIIQGAWASPGGQTASFGRGTSRWGGLCKLACPGKLISGLSNLAS